MIFILCTGTSALIINIFLTSREQRNIVQLCTTNPLADVRQGPCLLFTALSTLFLFVRSCVPWGQMLKYCWIGLYCNRSVSRIWQPCLNKLLVVRTFVFSSITLIVDIGRKVCFKWVEPALVDSAAGSFAIQLWKRINFSNFECLHTWNLNGKGRWQLLRCAFERIWN